MDLGFIAVLVIAILAILGVFIDIPIISDYAFWVMTGALLLFLGMAYDRERRRKRNKGRSGRTEIHKLEFGDIGNSGRFNCSTLMPTSASADRDRECLAPLGRLRVGVFAGSPLSMVVDRSSAETCGLCHDLGAEFAKRLDVPVEYLTFQNIADVIGAMKAGEVDFTVSNATPARAADVDFTQTLLSLELGYLVPARSSLTEAGELDRAGVRIGVTKGSTSERTLPAKFKKASVVPAENVRTAIEMLNDGALDVYATNKPTLFEMSDSMPGSRVLAGNWGLEHVAIAIPRGREAAMVAVRGFATDVQSSGLLAQLEKRVGLRGAVAAASR
jgi:polar amino acid transport system substrate-binding protein